MSGDSTTIEPRPDRELSAAEEGAPGWKRTLWVMWAAQMVAILGFSFVLPFLPFYIRQLGVGDDHAVLLWTGALGSVVSIAFAIAAPLWGIVADRYGRRKMVLRAMVGGALVLSAMGMVTSVQQLLYLRLLQGIMTGTIGASIAMVSAMTPRRHLGYALGLMQTAVLTGSATGPWLGGMMADAMGYRWPFVVSGGMCLVAAGVVLLFTREYFVPPPLEQARQESTLQLVRAAPGFTTMLGIFFLVGLAGTIVVPIFPLFVERLNGQAHLNTITGTIIGIAGVTEGIAAVTIGRLSDRMGQKKILVGCTFASGLMCAPQAIATSVGQLFALRGALGLAGGGTAPTINALVGRLMPEGSYGRMFGLTSSMAALGGGLGPMLGGLLAVRIGLQWPFVVVGAMLVLISGLAALRVVEPHHWPAPTEEEECAEAEGVESVETVA